MRRKSQTREATIARQDAFITSGIRFFSVYISAPKLLLFFVYFFSRFVASLSTECITFWVTCISMLAVSPSSVLTAPVSST